MTDELRDGYWTRGLVRRWVGERPADEPDPPERGKCEDCGCNILKKSRRCIPCFKISRLPDPNPGVVPELIEWPEYDAKDAHRAFVMGRRDQWAREGERAYQRAAKRRQRARSRGCSCRPHDGLCEACLAWAHDDSIKASWRRSTDTRWRAA